MSATIIGITGFRRVGKSELGQYLVEQHGFQRAHPFAPWKAALVTLYTGIGIPQDEAERMVDGDLKDTPCALLPEGVASRYLMERLGKFAGVELGPSYTLGFSLRSILDQDPDAKIVVESVVYEVDVVRSLGGHLVKVVRDGTAGAGLETDSFVEQIKPDSTFVNSADDLPDLMRDFNEHLANLGLVENSDEPILEQM